MSRIAAFVVVFVVVCLPTWASEPGQPLDCSDWWSLVPGYSCVEWSGDASTHAEWFDGWDDYNEVIDNTGRLLRVRELGTATPCGWADGIQIEWFDGQQVGSLGRIEGRCSSPTGLDTIKAETVVNGSHNRTVKFDAVNGRLLVPVQTDRHWVLAIEGFTTLHEIRHSYDTGVIGVRVPVWPEGFDGADYFETYWGDLASVGDWSQAQPLQCGYPATAPGVGDYLTVDDTLPTPAPGRGYYYLTAVNYQGQRRYGRQSNGGVLSGRDPAVLPACSN